MTITFTYNKDKMAASGNCSMPITVLADGKPSGFWTRYNRSPCNTNADKPFLHRFIVYDEQNNEQFTLAIPSIEEPDQALAMLRHNLNYLMMF